MEDSVVKSDSTETSRKVRSLDLQSLYVEKPEVSKRKRHSKSRKGEAFISKKSRIRRKGRFEATLSDSETVPKKKRRGLGSNKSEKDGYDSEKKKNMSDKKKNNAGFSGLNSISQSLGDKAIVIPKRPRGFLRRKKSESTAPLITEKVDANTPAPNSGKKRKKRLDESKENAFDNDEFDSKLKGEDDNLVVSRKRNLQKKNLVPEKRTLTEFGPLSVEDSTKFGEDPLEDDEENLEENAARMLSSRFDPSCTGFSPKSTNGSPFSQAASCRRDQGDSMGVAGRVLRPRRKDKGFARKRRHFYEVCSRDMDPYWVIKQRIRVFWPLDQSWYFGLVKDYNPVTKLHHVKYDDREEEWIDLQNERFKLLLFPSELRGKLKPEKSGGEGRNVTNRDDSGESSSNVSGFTDSEPIISWLARSRRVNSAPFNFSNKQKDSKLCKKLSADHCSVLMQKDNSSCVVPEKSDSGEVVKTSELRGKIAKVPVVYFRKRFNTRKRVGSTLERSYGLLRFTSSPTKLWQVELKMRLPHLCVLDPSFAADRFWMHSSLLHLEYGTVMIVWPKVLLELLFVDNVMGLRCFLFRGCLRDAVALICKILATFYRPIKNEDKMDMNHPVTSFGLNLSGMQKQGGQLAYVFCSFLETHNSKWTRLDAKLKQFHMTVKELSLVEFTYAKLRNLQCECEVPLLQGIDISEECKNTNTNNSYCMFTEKAAWSNSFGQSIASVPVPFLGMHLKFLMEKNATAIQKLNKAASQECMRNSEKLTDDSSPVEDSSDLSEITLDNVGCSVSQAISGSEWLSCSLPKVETDSLSVSNDAEWMRSTCNSLNGELNVAGNSSGHQDHRNGGADGSSARFRRCISHIGPLRDDERSCSSFPDDISSPDKSDPGCSVPNKINSQTPMLRRADSQRYDRGPRPHLASDLSWNMNDFTFRSPNPTAPRSVWNRNKHSSVPSFSNSSKFWPDGGSDFLRNGSISGCRKPRSQISYLLPFGPGEIGSKPRSHRRRGRPYKKIKPDEEKKTSGGPANSRSRREPLICDANLLVSSGDRGWRECGAKVVLEFNDHRDWRILVKVSWATRYSHKAHQFLQPGSTNRYTHAMMWKGGKDWTLEFSDRSQWVIFKEMYEECYNRNVRAASVKNIPIPGVRLIEDSDDYVVETPFVRSSSKYFRQVGTEVDSALDPCCVLYDMDSEDEDWLSKSRNLMESGERELPEISHEVFEKVMDMFEKVAYAQKREEFMGDEMEHLMGEVGPLDVVKAIYLHWLQKRKKKGMPLIRQFQPALWERYQEQVKQWELVTSNISNTSNGGKGKVSSAERPPMFAFCLRPRGLEVPNKGSKQRSHKKISHMGSFSRDHDGIQPYGRKSNGFNFADERPLVTVPNYDPTDVSYWSPRDSSSTAIVPFNGNVTEKIHYQKLQRSHSKKTSMSLSPRDSQIVPLSYIPKLMGKRNGVRDWGSVKHRNDQFGSSDTDEFKLRDASSEAQHLSNMAKLKREKAQWLLHKADLALHKATVALTIAEAIKASEKDLIGDG